MVHKNTLEILEFCKSKFFIVDHVVYWKWGPRKGKPAGWTTKDGYISISLVFDDVDFVFQAHRVIFLMHHGFLPEIVDHIDRNPANNDIENLRAADKKLNCINSGMFSSNTSGHKGVSWHAGAWTAQIKNNQKKIHLGRFKNIEDAIRARKLAEERLWGDIL